MATWVLHLRVAKRILEAMRLSDIDETAYYVGSITPDCGRMVDPFTYVPPKDVSHWKREGVSYEQRFEDNAEFYKKYCENEQDKLKRSLFLGYYIHILTDTIYVRNVIHPFINANGKPFWRANIDEIRAGWYEIDYRFLDTHKEFYPLQLLAKVKEFPNKYFDYFEPDDITDRVLNCVELYSNSEVHLNQRFLTVNEDEAYELIALMTEEIIGILRDKHNY